jgi:hypothetical protein
MRTEILDELERSGFIVTMTEGISMRPLIRSGIDAVHIIKKPETQKKGDVVLYKRDDGQLVMHRIVAVKKDNYTLCGDHEIFREKGIREDQILGVMAGFFRGTRYVDCSRIGCRLYSILWRSLYPVRRLVIPVLIRMQRDIK